MLLNGTRDAPIAGLANDTGGSLTKTTGVAILAVLFLGSADLKGQVVGTGSSSACIVFGCFPAAQPGQSYQQVWDATNFVGPGYLTEVRFFLDHTTGVGELLSNYHLNLEFSTTQSDVNQLIGAWLDRGPDRTNFWGGVSMGPAPQVLAFAYQGPGRGFYYDPLAGNLLLYITNYFFQSGGNAFYKFDRGTSQGMFSSEAFGYYGPPLPPNSGYQVEFVWATTVPEPTSMSLVALGLVGLTAMKRRRHGH